MWSEAFALMDLIGVRLVVVEGLGCDVVLYEDDGVALVDMGTPDVTGVTDWVLSCAAYRLAA